MKLRITGVGFNEGARKIRSAASSLEERVLQGVGDALIAELRRRVSAGEIIPPKLTGGVALVKTGAYLASWRARMKGGSIEVGPTGGHPEAGMSNEALGELLEYGHGDVPARPHMRPLYVWLSNNAEALVMKEVRRVLGGR